MSNTQTQTPQPATRLFLAALSRNSNTAPLTGTVQCRVLASAENLLLVADHSGWLVIRHSKGTLDVPGVSFTLDQHVLIERGQQFTTITLLPDKRIKSCVLPEFNWADLFPRLGQAIQTRSSAVLCSLHREGQRIICSDASQEAVQLTVFSVPGSLPEGQYALINMSFRQDGARVLCSFDGARSLAIRCGPPITFSTVKFIDRPPSINLQSFGELQSLAKNTLVNIPCVRVVAMTRIPTASKGTVQHVRFTFPGDQNITLLSIFEASRFAPDHCTAFIASDLNVSEFQGGKVLTCTQASAISFTVDAPQQWCPSAFASPNPDFELLAERDIEEPPLKIMRLDSPSVSQHSHGLTAPSTPSKAPA
jgi:hypothetical protein